MNNLVRAKKALSQNEQFGSTFIEYKTTIVRDKFIYIVIFRGLSSMIKMSYRYKLDQIERIEKLYSTDKKEKSDWEEKVIAQIINKELPNGTWEDFLKTIEKTFRWYAPAEMRVEYPRKRAAMNAKNLREWQKLILRVRGPAPDQGANAVLTVVFFQDVYTYNPDIIAMWEIALELLTFKDLNEAIVSHSGWEMILEGGYKFGQTGQTSNKRRDFDKYCVPTETRHRVINRIKSQWLNGENPLADISPPSAQ